MSLFDIRLNKAMKQDFKSSREIIDYCIRETRKNYSDAKCRDYQCICEYLIYCFEKKVKIDFVEYQYIQFKSIWGK